MATIISCVLRNLLLPTLSCLILSGCLGPYVYQEHISESMAPPRFLMGQAIMPDGYLLPVAVQSGSSPPAAIVLALHGFNDYRNAFHDIGNYLVSRNISLIAYDQRGFGETEGRGYWHGTDSMVQDLLNMVHLIKTRYPDIPLYILGESMGGAVTLVAAKALRQEGTVRGIILVAPAIWAYNTMPWYQRCPLWFFAHTLPWFHLSNKGMDIMPSDNIEMLIALGRDPLVIKGARADAIYGLTLLMSDALEASAQLDVPALILYGKNDEIVPKSPTCEMLRALPADSSSEHHFILYENGYHMLTRDLQAGQVYDDIENWIQKHNHGEDQGGEIARQDMEFLCE